MPHPSCLKIRYSILWKAMNFPTEEISTIYVTAMEAKREDREQFSAEYGARSILINPGQDVCLDRLDSDSDRSDDAKIELRSAINRWFTDYTEWDRDELLEDETEDKGASAMKAMHSKWYQIVDKQDRAEIWIYEQIGEDWWSGEGITAKGFQKELSAIKAKEIDLHINSPGGNVFDGITIYNLLKQHPAKITTYIDGLAASIASVIALAGDSVTMAENALWMMHNPSGMVMGTSQDMRSMADVLDKVRSSIATAYVGKSGKSEDEVYALMDDETWMTAEEAKSAGLVDDIGSEMDLAACAKFVPVMDKAGFKHIPEMFPTIRNLERALRDAGCGPKLAKVILAKGYPYGFRDEVQEEIPPVGPVQRDVEQEKQEKNDSVAELLIKAEILSPSD